MDHKKKIVILGGGNGGSISIRAMKPYLEHYALSAVIAVSDSGSSSGKLRQELGVLPPGDILRAILAMSTYDYGLLKRIFYDTRYAEKGKLQGFGIGHLFLGLVEKYNGGVVDAIRALAQAVDVVGPVFPATLNLTDLCVELDNGNVVKGEHEIDRPHWDRNVRITKAWLDPVVDIYTNADKAIREADYIIIGPGSCYTSIIATLLPHGMAAAIRDSRAKLIFVAGNTIESDGETGPCSTSELVTTIQKYLPRPLDVVISNTSILNFEQEIIYRQKKWEKITIDHDMIDVPVVAAPFEFLETGLDPEKLGALIHEYISNT